MHLQRKKWTRTRPTQFQEQHDGMRQMRDAVSPATKEPRERERENAHRPTPLKHGGQQAAPAEVVEQGAAIPGEGQRGGRPRLPAATEDARPRLGRRPRRRRFQHRRRRAFAFAAAFAAAAGRFLRGERGLGQAHVHEHVGADFPGRAPAPALGAALESPAHRRCPQPFLTSPSFWSSVQGAGQTDHGQIQRLLQAKNLMRVLITLTFTFLRIGTPFIFL